MHLDTLTVYQFRNLETQRIVFSAPVSVLIGRNGHGKTSLLEAIYLFSHTRSFRAAQIRDFIRWQKSEGASASVEGQFTTAEGRKSVRYELADGTRKVFLNEKRIESAQNFYGSVRVIEFTPDDLFLVKGEPTQRRTFLDKILTLIDTRYVDHLVRYQRALKNRNLVLQRNVSSEGELRALHQLLIEHGTFLARSRQRYASEIAPLFSSLYERIAVSERECASLSLRSHFLEDGDVMDAKRLEEEYEQRMAEDRTLQRTAFGVHRDDLIIKLDTGFGLRAARSSASQGQTRSLALALKMAAVQLVSQMTGEDPILLLDDVESELDSTRRKALNQLILDYRSQIIITTTDVTKLPFELGDRVDFFAIEAGRVSPGYHPENTSKITS